MLNRLPEGLKLDEEMKKELLEDSDGDGIANVHDEDFDPTDFLERARQRQGVSDRVDLGPVEITAEELAAVPQDDREAALEALGVAHTRALVKQLTAEDHTALFHQAKLGAQSIYPPGHGSRVELDHPNNVRTAKAHVEQWALHTKLAHLSPERLAELLAPLDNEVKRPAEYRLGERQRKLVEEANRVAAMSVEEKRIHDALHTSLPAGEVAGTMPGHEAYAYKAQRCSDGEILMIRHTQFPAGYQFKDVSKTSEGYYRPWNGVNWETCTADKYNAVHLGFTYDARSGLYAFTSSITTK